MAKIDYLKVELAFIKSLRNIFLENLKELAAIATQAKEGAAPLNTEEVDLILKSFRVELKKLKTNNAELYQLLELNEEQEKRLLKPSKDFNRQDWLKIIELNDRLLAINAEKTKAGSITEEDINRVAQERVEHKNKRFNVKKGWLPLH
jgi:hypothetical protein